ncbi:MAG: septal ring lytic transglycosylase RlpA family protein [Afipia sp.]|nr:septal ring lytic transglycosylase RlpA family protein [Afipia sp.]
MNTTLIRGRGLRAPFRNGLAILAIGTSIALAGSYGIAFARKNADANPAKDAREAKASADSSQSFSGVASFYGKNDEPGGETASGQKFDEDAMTAAHRTLPFGTRLKVTHAGKSVVVTVNDRGPFVEGRVLDLSKGAASAIGITEDKGLGRIVAEVQ